MSKQPKIRNLSPDAVIVDPTVQRGLDKAWVTRLANSWDDEKVGVPQVSLRSDGNHYVTDGQHRIAALIELGRGADPIPMQVIESSGRQEEAKRFVAMNAEKRRPSGIDIYQIQLVSGDPIVLEIDKVLDKHGLQVAGAVTQPGNVGAVSALRSVHKLGGADLLDRTLTVLGDAYGKEPGAYNGAIIRAIGTLIDKKGREIDTAELSEKLAKGIDPGRLLGKGRSLAETWRKSLHLAIIDVALSVYNLNKRTRRVQF